MRIGFIGLGRMGANMVRRLLRDGHEIVAYNRTPERTKEIAGEGAEAALSIGELVDKLQKPRAVWIMVPAGDATEAQIEELLEHLEPGDTIIDGGNTNFHDDQRRHPALAARGISYVDAGVSGGIWGLQVGYCLMVGGARDAVEPLQPLFRRYGVAWPGELGAATHERLTVAVQKPRRNGKPHHTQVDHLELPRYERGSTEATRRAYAHALVALGRARGDVIALDADVDNSTYTDLFAEAMPERYFEMYIAEQQMAAAAVDLQVRGWIPFASTYGAFWSRAFDFIRMAAVSRANIRLAGSHAGVSIGPDGPSQMGLEDIASFRTIWGSTVLYPSDANQTAQLVGAMVDRPGVVYLRTTRGETPVIYDADEMFPIGGSKVVRSSPADAVTLIGAGVTLHEAIKAADRLATDRISARVIDLYSIKPIDAATIATAARETVRIVTVEDHRPEGGLGEAVLTALADEGVQARVRRLAVTRMPGSATPKEQLADAGIDARAIAAAAQVLLGH